MSVSVWKVGGNGLYAVFLNAHLGTQRPGVFEGSIEGVRSEWGEVIVAELGSEELRELPFFLCTVFFFFFPFCFHKNIRRVPSAF